MSADMQNITSLYNLVSFFSPEVWVAITRVFFDCGIHPMQGPCRTTSVNLIIQSVASAIWNMVAAGSVCCLVKTREWDWRRLAATLVATGLHHCKRGGGGRVWEGGVGNDGHVSTLLPIAKAEGGIEGGSLIGTRCKSPCHSSSSSLMRVEATGCWSVALWSCRRTPRKQAFDGALSNKP